MQDTYLDMDLLRFTTAGSVDDGKSTLIGRLLYDSKAIFQDQLDAIKLASEKRGDDYINLALLTDGLRAEREQGITIDVAYRYFHTPNRKFIIADTPGHLEYTRNMVTGASTADAAIILVDASRGVMEQTLRHAFIASLLRIPNVLICVNKMDLVDYSEATFVSIQQRFLELSNSLKLQNVMFVPISALKGDNVVLEASGMPWYKGPTLMHLLDTIETGNNDNLQEIRFPVQYVIRAQNKDIPNYCGYAGRLVGGTIRVGDKVKVLPTGSTSIVRSIDFFDQHLQTAATPQSVAITLTDDLDVTRGSLIVPADSRIEGSLDINIMVCWLGERPLNSNGKYLLKHTTNEYFCKIIDVKYKIDISTLERNYSDMNIGLNDIACISLRTNTPIFCDTYTNNRTTGSLLIIDQATNITVGAGMIM